jgi:hypothetical protein
VGREAVDGFGGSTAGREPPYGENPLDVAANVKRDAEPTIDIQQRH